MAWLQLALRGARSKNDFDLYEQKFRVRVQYLDGSHGDVPISVNDTFGTLASAIGPARLMLLRRKGTTLCEIRERRYVYDALLKWQRDGDPDPHIVAPKYGPRPAHNKTPRKMSAKQAQHTLTTVIQAGWDSFRVKTNFETSADQIARRICPSAHLGLFSARRKGKTSQYFHFELLPRDACIRKLVQEWKLGGKTDKVLLIPLTQYIDFDEESGSATEDSEYSDYHDADSEYDDENSGYDEYDDESGAREALTSVGTSRACAAAAEHSACMEVSQSGDACEPGRYDHHGDIADASGTDAKDNDGALSLSELPSSTSAPRNPELCEVSPALNIHNRRDIDSIDSETVPVTFQELSLRDEAEWKARKSAHSAGGGKIEHSDVPVYELDLTADALGPAMTSSISWGLVHKLFLYRKDALWDPSAPLESVIHDLITEVIRLAGKGDEVQLRHISEEEIYAALLCETDAQRDLVQLDVPLLACTAVSNVLSSEHAEVLELHAQIARANLHEARRTMRRGQRKHRYATGTEARALMDIFRPMQLVVGVVEQAPRAGPAGLASRLMGAAAPPQSRPAPSPHALLFADKLTAIAEVPSYTNRAIIRKGFLVEGRYAGRIVLSIQDTNYNMRRWITPPSRNATELVRFLALAVLCSSEELRDILLAADRAIGGAVSAHYDACQEDYRRFLEEAKVRAEQVDIKDEKEREEERRYPQGPPKKIETAWPEPFKLS